MAAWRWQIERRGIDRPAQQPVRALVDAENAPSMALHGTRDHGADHGVEPGAIAAAGQNADRLFKTHEQLWVEGGRRDDARCRKRRDRGRTVARSGARIARHAASRRVGQVSRRRLPWRVALAGKSAHGWRFAARSIDRCGDAGPRGEASRRIDPALASDGSGRAMAVNGKLDMRTSGRTPVNHPPPGSGITRRRERDFALVSHTGSPAVYRDPRRRGHWRWRHHGNRK